MDIRDHCVYRVDFSDGMSYVGRSVDLEYRMDQHKNEGRIRAHQRRTGLAPRYSIVEDGLTKDQAMCIENLEWQLLEWDLRLSKACPPMPWHTVELPEKYEAMREWAWRVNLAYYRRHKVPVKVPEFEA